MQSLGDLHYDSDVMLDRLSQHIMDKLDKASAVDLTQLACPFLWFLAGTLGVCMEPVNVLQRLERLKGIGSLQAL